MSPLPPILPPRLQAGQTIGLINPSSAIYERAPYEHTHATLQAMGFKVREAPNLRARYGHMAGTPQQRADDIHTLFADPEVHAILGVTGGSGANRVLPLLDYELIRRHPKALCGYSDLTALITAVQQKTGLVTFHAPLGRSQWNTFTHANFQAVLVEAKAHVLRNEMVSGQDLVPQDGRTSTLRAGKARGPLLGGNLAVLTSLSGTPYMPKLDGAVLFLEDVNESIYRVDRMFSTLMLSGALANLAGVVLGGFSDCEPNSGNFGTLTLDEVFDDYLLPLKVPVYRGAQFGHIKHKLTLPMGAMAEMDADAGTITLLQPAVV